MDSDSDENTTPAAKTSRALRSMQKDVDSAIKRSKRKNRKDEELADAQRNMHESSRRLVACMNAFSDRIAQAMERLVPAEDTAAREAAARAQRAPHVIRALRRVAVSEEDHERVLRIAKQLFAGAAFLWMLVDDLGAEYDHSDILDLYRACE